MGFSMPDFDVRADIIPGQVSKLRLVPDKVGTFTFLCDIFCGSGHETMNGTITVVA
jgi:cytochrome c oxidase subunit 2